MPIRPAAGSSGVRAGEKPRFASEVRQAYTAQEVDDARRVLAEAAVAPVVAGNARRAAGDEGGIGHEADMRVEPLWGSARAAALLDTAAEAEEAAHWLDLSEGDEGGSRMVEASVEESVEGGEHAETAHEPELVPVAASVFDDDFFRTDRVRRAAEARSAAPTGVPVEMMRHEVYGTGGLEGTDSSEHGEGSRDFAFGGYASAGESRSMAREDGPPALFAGASAGSHVEQQATDELDIPAFLRRSR